MKILEERGNRRRIEAYEHNGGLLESLVESYI